MRKSILIVCSLALTSVLTSCNDNPLAKVKAENVEAAAQRDANADKFAKMKFEEEEHDFGTINKGERQEYTFKFTNVGDVPLIVSKVQSTCGCTVPKKPEGPVKPGEQGEIKVTYNGSGRGAVKKTITITANTESKTEHISIKANVLDPATAGK